MARWTPRQKANALKLCRELKNWKAVLTRTKVPRSTLERWCKVEGIDMVARQQPSAEVELEEDKPPECPEYLSEAAKQAWADLMAEIWNAGRVEQQDWPVIEQAAIAWSDVRGLTRQIDDEGYLTEDRFGMPTANPAIIIRDRAQDKFLRCCDQLGIGPAARQKVKGGPKTEDKPPLEPPKDISNMSPQELKALEKAIGAQAGQTTPGLRVVR